MTLRFSRFRDVKFCRFSRHTLHLERKVEVFPAGSEAGSAHIHFILKRKLKFFLQRQVKFCRFEVKFCRFSLHTLHLERKVEVFLAGSEAGSAHILFILIEVFPAGAARSADQRVQGSTSPDHLIS